MPAKLAKPPNCFNEENSESEDPVIDKSASDLYLFVILTIILFTVLYLIDIPSPAVFITEKYTLN